MEKIDLSIYDNSWYQTGGSKIKMLVWYFVNELCMNSGWLFVSSIRRSILRIFGAKIGEGVIIKPHVNIKYPWKLSIGNNCWIGENVWIDNLAEVTIGDNVCISQGAMLLCGNHNYKKTTFDLMIGEIKLEDGAWVCAKSVVCPGVTMKSHSILTVGSIATKDCEAYSIYQGNPAVKIKERVIGD
ncbi:MAG: WcaF family extracellular polysaccharide biosynthesis acetyltransferase [Paludibacteraceae bacterium]|nr:WcaF family extracellular polysaccharide biosynthesis acetyltransferase [Paludibacteraceae bacterium]